MTTTPPTNAREGTPPWLEHKWHVHTDGVLTAGDGLSPDSRKRSDAQRREIKTYIANAVNSHDALLAACRTALGTFKRQLHSEETIGTPFCGDDVHGSIRTLTTAIALAERRPS
jgi:hypothetical protein